MHYLAALAVRIAGCLRPAYPTESVLPVIQSPFCRYKRWVNTQQATPSGHGTREGSLQQSAAIRQERGVSQETLAYEADVDRTYISKLEKREPSVGLNILVKLSNVLAVEPTDLLRRPAKKAK